MATRSFKIPDLKDDKGRPVHGARIKARRCDTHVWLDEEVTTDEYGNATFSALPVDVDVSLHATWGGTTTGLKERWFYSHINAVSEGGTGASDAATAASNLGLGTGDSPQFTAVNLGHATDTTVTRVSAGLIAVEGDNLIRASDVDDTPVNGQTAVPVSSNWAYDHDNDADVHDATAVNVAELGTAFYDDVQDFVNFFGQRTLLSGGAISARADALTGVNTGGAGFASFEISGDLTAVYKEDDIISVSGSTGNDGNYTLKANSTHSAGTTTITVDEAVSNGTVDGSIYGALNIASSTAWCKETNSDTAVGKFFDKAAGQSLIMTNLSINLIYLDYNAGTPRFVLATTPATYGFQQDHILIGVVFRQGATAHIFQSDLLGVQGINRAFMHQVEHHGAHRSSGLVTSDGLSLALSITAGVIYAGLTRQATTVNGSTWSYWYTSDSGTTWHEDTGILALVQSYNNIASGKVSLTTNRFGVHWVYVDYEGSHCHIVYGQGDYTASEAEEALVPSVLPPIVTQYGILIAKIINQEGEDKLTITYPWTTVFTSSLATDHGSLGGLDGDDHTQYLLADGTRELTDNMAVTALKTIDGRDISVDGAKLDAIGAGADVVGPASSTDNEIARQHSTTGKVLQTYTSNPPTISDTGDVNIDGDLDVENIVVSGNVDGVDVSAHAVTKSANATLGHVIVETASKVDVDANGKLTLGSDVLLEADLENPPTEDLATKAPTSEWAFDHNAATLSSSVHNNTSLYRGYLTANQADIPAATSWVIRFDTAQIDVGSNYSNGDWYGTAAAYLQADADSDATHIEDDDATFTNWVGFAFVQWTDSADANPGTGYVTAMDSDTLTIVKASGADFTASGKYYIQKNYYTVPTTGTYVVAGCCRIATAEADKRYAGGFRSFRDPTTTQHVSHNIHASIAAALTPTWVTVLHLTANDLVHWLITPVGLAAAYTIAGTETYHTWGSIYLLRAD